MKAGPLIATAATPVRSTPSRPKPATRDRRWAASGESSPGTRARARTGPAQNVRLTTWRATIREYRYRFILVLSPGNLDPFPDGRRIVELIEHGMSEVRPAQPERRPQVLGDAAPVPSSRREVVQGWWPEHRPVQIGPAELLLEARPVPPAVAQEPSDDVSREEAEHGWHPEVQARAEGSDEDAPLDARGAHAGDEAPSALRVDPRGSQLARSREGDHRVAPGDRSRRRRRVQEVALNDLQPL